MTQLSIIINHYKKPELLKNCLISIKNNIQDINYQVIVVDSQSSPKNEKAIKGLFPEAVFLGFKKNIGFGRSVNQGIKKSKGQYLLIINADIIIAQKESIKEMLNCLEKNPEIGLLGPKLLSFEGTYQPSCFRFYSPLTILSRRTFLKKSSLGKKSISRFLMKGIFDKKISEIKKPIPVDWLMGSALFAKKTSIEKVGLLDERFFMYFEDVDWCRRFWEKGLKVVYFPKVHFFHKHLKASKKTGGIFDLFLSKYAWIHLLSALKYFLKYGIKPPSYGL